MLRTRFCERFGIEAPIVVAPLGPISRVPNSWLPRATRADSAFFRHNSARRQCCGAEGKPRCSEQQADRGHRSRFPIHSRMRKWPKSKPTTAARPSRGNRSSCPIADLRSPRAKTLLSHRAM